MGCGRHVANVVAVVDLCDDVQPWEQPEGRGREGKKMERSKEMVVFFTEDWATDFANFWTVMIDSASTMCSCWSGLCTVGLLRTTTLSAFMIPALSQELILNLWTYYTCVCVCVCEIYRYMYYGLRYKLQ